MKVERTKRNQTVARRQNATADADAPDGLWRLDNFGDRRHTLTAEDRRKGQIAATARKKELAKTVRERFAEKVARDAEEIYQEFRAAGRQGDWRASDSILRWCLGNAPAMLELSGAVDNNVTVQVIASMPVPALTPDASSDLAAGDVYELDAGDVEEA